MVIFVGGRKSAGKSLISSLVLYHYMREKNNPILIDAGYPSCDVFEAHKNTIKACAFSFANDGIEYILHMLSRIEAENHKTPIVVNTAPDDVFLLREYTDILDNLNVKIFLPILPNESEEHSLQLLDMYARIVQKPLCIVKNGLFGGEENYENFLQSTVYKNGIKNICLPSGHEEISRLNVENVPFIAIDEDNNSLSFGKRTKLKAWLAKAEPVIAEALAIAEKYNPVKG